MREPNPINRIELSEKNTRLRWIAVIALLVIGVVGITIGITSALKKDSGWQPVQVATQERSCSENFILQYHFGSSGAEATAVNTKLQSVYGAACVKAYQVFTPDEAIAGVNNLYYVNHNVNQVITVDPLLYAAFERLENTPWLYLGPAYNHYYNMIYNTEEAQLDQYDPVVSQEAAEYLAAIVAFAGDRSHIRLELLGDHQVMLHVSQEYLTFAAREEVENFLDFAYLTNAFTIDYLAQVLTEEGLTNGYLVSSDGYTRNLVADTSFRFNIFDRVENLVYPAGAMEYKGPISLVFLKDFPTANSDANYRGRTDRFLHLFVDPVDGICRTSVKNMVSYSYDMDCVDVVLKMLPCFVGAQFSVPAEVYSIWCEDGVICYNDAAITFHDLLRDSNVAYTTQLKA